MNHDSTTAHSSHLPRLSAALLGALLLLLASCGNAASSKTAAVNPASLPHVALMGSDDAYMNMLSSPVPAGLMVLTFSNTGHQPHQLTMAKLKNNVTTDQVLGAAKTGSTPALSALVTFMGGVNTIAPNTQQQAIIYLAPGQYAAICFIGGPHGVPHYQAGMIMPFTVAGTPANHTVAAAMTIHLVNFGFDMPATIKQGTMIAVTNQGNEPHEMAIIKPAPGRTPQDVINDAMQKGPAGTLGDLPMGGMAALAPGQSGWYTLNLPPGQYVAICYIGDPKTGKDHAMLGMAHMFTVQP